MTWMDDAACRNHDPELWFPDRSDTHIRAQAIAICVTCPVQTACATYALTHQITDGIWGGIDYTGTHYGPGRPPAACGTSSGYRRHLRRKETPCTECRAASAAAAKLLPSYLAARQENNTWARNTKITPTQVHAIREAATKGQRQTDLARQYGISATQVHKIIKRIAWADV